MIIPEGLRYIASQLHEPLYIVGGYVRNSLLSNGLTDIDICSSLTPEEVTSQLEGKAKILPVNPKIGTLKLLINEEEYEYTSFREDSYPIGGYHKPYCVKFVKDIKKDALRRDFTINAIYYNINKNEYVDPLERGIIDLQNKQLATTDKPEKVFSEDGLRLMRLARIAAELGFEIDENTFQHAIYNKEKLKDIAPERKTSEFDRILAADKRYLVKDAHYRGLIILGELGLWRYIIPQVEDCMGVMQRADKHKYDVYMHSLQAVKHSPCKIRLAMLLHDIGKPVALKREGNMHKHAQIGADMIKEILSVNLVYPKVVIQQVERLVRHHMYDFDGKTGKAKLRLFVQKNHDIIDELLEVKEADARASGYEYDGHIVERMRSCYIDMQKKQIPLTLKDLDVNGIDLLELGAINVELSALLNAVLQENARQGRRLSKEEQLNYALYKLNE